MCFSFDDFYYWDDSYFPWTYGLPIYQPFDLPPIIPLFPTLRTEKPVEIRNGTGSKKYGGLLTNADKTVGNRDPVVNILRDPNQTVDKKLLIVVDEDKVETTTAGVSGKLGDDGEFTDKTPTVSPLVSYGVDI